MQVNIYHNCPEPSFMLQKESASYPDSWKQGKIEDSSSGIIKPSSCQKDSSGAEDKSEHKCTKASKVMWKTSWHYRGFPSPLYGSRFGEAAPIQMSTLEHVLHFITWKCHRSFYTRLYNYLCSQPLTLNITLTLIPTIGRNKKDKY